VTAAPVSAATVTLTWNPNAESDLAGYVVAYGTSSGQYGVTVDVGNHTSFQFTEPDPTVRYYFAVSAYNTSGLRSTFSAEVSTTDPVTTLALSGVTTSVPAPQGLGTSVVFSASTTGGVAPPQYKWRVSDGSTWRVAQDWSTASIFTWTPTTANPNYTVSVWARSATSSVDAPDNPASSANIPFPIFQSLTLTSLNSNVPSPQPVGTTVQFTASAVGGTSPYQFKWLVSTGTSWTVAQDWSASSTFSWTPTAANANYSVGVWVRSAGNATDAPENSSSGTTISFAITPATVTITSLTSNKAAPELVNSKIMFSATASGAAVIQYKWLVFDGATWWTAQDWSANNKFSWTPLAANPDYQVQVRAQNAANVTDNAGASVLFPILASSTTNGNGYAHGRK
jgi:hypothetical protein